MLTRLIAANYDLALPIECSLFSSGDNDVYLVASREHQYVLRLSRVRWNATYDEQAYRFELDLLSYLHERGISVSHPLPRRDKEVLGAIDAPEGKRFFALFSFADGEIPWPLAKEQSYALGKTLARLHLTADGFLSSHSRFQLDEEFLIERPIRQLRSLPQVVSEDIAFLEQLGGSLREKIRGLPRQKEVYGIIHGDFWWQNAHFVDGKATLFDFDECGYGWRIYDIASLSASAKLFGVDLPGEVIDAFISGYQSVKVLTEPETAAIPAFEKIRVLWALGIWTTFIDVSGIRMFNENYRFTFPILKKWVEEERASP